MLISGDISTNKTDLLVKSYAELLNSGINSSSILVLVQNSNLKQNFINKTLELLNVNSIEKLNVHSFFSLVYNTINDNTVTIRDRDTMQQITLKVDELDSYILNKIKF